MFLRILIRQLFNSKINYLEIIYNYLEIRNKNLEFFLKNRSNWIELIIENTAQNISVDFLLDLYRNHFPTINLYHDAKVFLGKFDGKTFACIQSSFPFE